VSALPRRVLVIKLGALGDFVQALGPMAAIRRHHAGAHVVLLTTPPFATLARGSGYFDEVWLDGRPPLLALARWWALRSRLVAGRFDRVYDLQTSDRTSWYFRLMGPGPRPEWSGIARGCSHPHLNPARERMHTAERQTDQLRVAGIAGVPPPEVSWAKAELGRFVLPPVYALLVPGGAAHRPAKRWPLERYAELARALVKRGLAPVVIGARADQPLGQAIASVSPEARDLTGATGLEEVASLARGAATAIGNDTGPMHLIAAVGCPALVLFSAASDPTLCAPRGERVVVLRRERLADLPLAAVLQALPARPASARSA
jgi:ADP-heptose:LPS heptosyltransferase